MKSFYRQNFLTLAFLMAASFTVAGTFPNVIQPLDINRDILVAQYDGRPDADDVHSQAAFGCMLLHEDLQGVTAYTVMNAYGTQKGAVIWDSTRLLNMIFPIEYDGSNQDTALWTNANREQGTGGWQRSIDFIAAKAGAILVDGGRVWIAEGGQSNFTRAWVEHLHQTSSIITPDLTRQNVIVVQHGLWNERHTDADDLAWVKANTRYIKIDSGNYGDGDHAKDEAATGTPDWKSNRKQLSGDWSPYYIDHVTLRADTESAANTNPQTRLLWQTSRDIIGDWEAGYSPIDEGGIDFSDTVAIWFILGLADRNINVMTLEQFWDRYVLTERALTQQSQSQPRIK